MADRPQLGFARGEMERLRAAHADKSHEELLELVCQLTRTYVLEQTIPFDIPLPEREEPPARPDRPDAPEEPEGASGEAEPEWRRFARLIEGIKRRTGLPQLEGFTVQADGRAVLTVDNQKITFGERVTVEFVPRRGVTEAPAAPAPAAPAAPAPPREAPAAPFAARPAPAVRPAPAARRPGPPGRSPPPPPAPQPAPPAAPEGGAPLADVDHVVERFRGLELE